MLFRSSSAPAQRLDGDDEDEGRQDDEGAAEDLQAQEQPGQPAARLIAP